MGYTHYWRRSQDFTQHQWEKICIDTLDVIVKHCDKKGVVLAFEYDSPATQQPSIWGGPKFLPTPPEVSPEIIRFNGWKDEGHETFMVTREKPDNGPSWDKDDRSFDFCKTARKPYDIAVCLVLLVMKRHAPKSISVSSDGEWDEEWTEARKVFKELFGVEAKRPWSATEKV